ncbi:MAG: hypothetical protein AAGF60_00255 [Pseudomonadota bacterium]
MNEQPKKRDISEWIDDGPEDGPYDEGYFEELERDLKASEAELDAGLGIPIEDVWKRLGLK